MTKFIVFACRINSYQYRIRSGYMFNLGVKKRVQNRVLHYDYEAVLPQMARLPLFLGALLSQARGMVFGFADWDWRRHFLGVAYLRKGTFKAMHLLYPNQTRLFYLKRVLMRFTHNSRKEWEACLIRRQRINEFQGKCEIQGMELLLEAQQKQRGVVLLSCHFDSLAMGVVLLGSKGLKINVAVSSVVENEKVHPAVVRFYRKKYQASESYMNGGKIHYYESRMRFFFDALACHETVVMMADMPGNGKASHATVNFLGKPCVLDNGAHRLAQKTGSLIGAFLCFYTSPGVYKVVCSPLFEPDDINALPRIYEFFSGYMLAHPSRWWASELFPSLVATEAC